MPNRNNVRALPLLILLVLLSSCEGGTATCDASGTWDLTILPNDGEGTCGLTPSDGTQGSFEIFVRADGSYGFSVLDADQVDGLVIDGENGQCIIMVTINDSGVLTDGTQYTTSTSLNLDNSSDDIVVGTGTISFNFTYPNGTEGACLQPLTVTGSRR